MKELLVTHPIHGTPEPVRMPPGRFSVKFTGFAKEGDLWYSFIQSEFTPITDANMFEYFPDGQVDGHFVLSPVPPVNAE